MSRTIELTRIHALNWYGYQDSLDVRGNLLLAGVTGSGKSILMDLIQFVLVGDQRAVRFNQSATGDRSDRTLKGYSLGDTKQEENGVTQYMRTSAITYVALEFTWPESRGEARRETWGIRAEFTSAAENQGRVTPFLIPTRLDRSHFLSSDRRPLEHAAFKALVDQRGGKLYTEGLEAYLRDMAQPAHLNFDRNILRALLPSAMSFTFLKSFNEFSRQFILPSDRLDVTDVTASYRSFLAYERDLNSLHDQYSRLEDIQKIANQLAGLRQDLVVSRHLDAELRLEHATESLTGDEKRWTKWRTELAGEEERLRVLDDSIQRSRNERDQSAALMNQTSDGQLYFFIRSRNSELSRRVADLAEVAASLEQGLKLRIRSAREWLKDLRKMDAELDPTAATSVEKALRECESRSLDGAHDTLRNLAETARHAAADAGRAGAPALKRLQEIRSQMGQLREEIAALKIGKLPFPTRMLDALNAGLPSKNGELPARPLCKLCEVADERWRPAIEIAFTRKFAVVVAPDQYDAAERIYHSLKASDLGGDAGRESLINPSKALKLRKPTRPGSLAEKIRCHHPVAESIVSQLFGDLICVEKREQLREHDYAILPDGFMARGSFVDRARFYDGNPFVGERGLQQQLAWKEKRRAELEAEEQKIRPVAEAILTIQEKARDQFEIPPTLYQDLSRMADLPRLQSELDENIARLKTIDRSKFDDLEGRISQLDASLKQMQEEQRNLLQSPRRRDVQTLENTLAQQRARVENLKERFDEVKGHADVSRYLGRLTELRREILERFPSKEVAAGKCNDRYHECQAGTAAAGEALKAKRRELASAHPKFEDLPIEAESNEAHERQLRKLTENEIPEYRLKAERERKHWEGLFRSQILDKLHGALQPEKDLLIILNQELKKRPIGQNTYQIRHWKNPDYSLYHELVEASSLARADDLFFASADPRYRDAINQFLTLLTERADSVEAARLLDYRHYYEYDMEVLEPDGRKTSVDRHSGKFSGGENQSPYFIAILASYLRAYRRYTSRRTEPSLGLVPIDEAFSKLSGERIKDCITAMKAFDLQGVFSMSTGNIPYAFEHCDWLIVVSKEERKSGKTVETRNIPVSLARESEEALSLMKG